MSFEEQQHRELAREEREKLVEYEIRCQEIVEQGHQILNALSKVSTVKQVTEKI